MAADKKHQGQITFTVTRHPPGWYLDVKSEYLGVERTLYTESWLEIFGEIDGHLSEFFRGDEEKYWKRQREKEGGK